MVFINGASLTLTNIGRFLPGWVRVKNKIKRVDRLLENESLQRDILMIFNKIISMLTSGCYHAVVLWLFEGDGHG